MLKIHITKRINKRLLSVSYDIEDKLKENIKKYDYETLKEYKREYLKSITTDDNDEILTLINDRIKYYQKQQRLLKELCNK